MMWKGGRTGCWSFLTGTSGYYSRGMRKCYNRNIRAASVKNIPIPGVRLVEENDDYGAEVPFVRNPARYIRQVQTDVEMAMDPSHILYDMDSDDERWLMLKKNCTEKHKYEKISEEVLEKAIDIFEKVSYAKLRDNFTDAEIEELLIGIGPQKLLKSYMNTGDRRGRNWHAFNKTFAVAILLFGEVSTTAEGVERTAARGNCAFSVGSQDKVTPPEKPLMFAFCLKPRGLDVPNKGSKQRSHRQTKPWRIRTAFCICLLPTIPLWQGEDQMGMLLEMIRRCMQAARIEQLNGSDLHEFRLRDASGAAQHALNLAKLKREKAQRLLYRADLAIHKAVVALMTAEAMKDSAENSNGVN
ncbi:UNVERIFIED_CONTAM: hypothetical protein Sangu_1624100 [Sesamum angustifolium]|uniref:Enhancer of polycomb-like protein n=1 Tax=Sesamum angustifolium TaxID=2727405 RepID=A0AAW2MJV0_9LAMI